jgi:hypothetical protein
MEIYLETNFAFLLPEHVRLFRYNFGKNIEWFFQLLTIEKNKEN